MSARSYFYRLGQQARSWNTGISRGQRILMPGLVADWALDAFDAGYCGWGLK